MNRHSGFTLIEVMVVVAIIAILAAIALPSYLDYLARSQVAEGIGLTTEAKSAVTEYFTSYTAWPTSNAAAGLAQPTSVRGKYVSSATVSGGGRIVIAYNRTSSSTRIRTQTLVMTPTDRGGSIEWSCGGTLALKYLPTACH